MPAEGLDWLPTEETLTDDEVVRLVRIGVEQLGIREVRFTGGEPLLRRGSPESWRAPRRCDPTPEVSLTTNALGLSRTAATLAAAGLDRVNVSLDTIRRDVFQEITRRDRLDDVLAGLAAAKPPASGRIKVNAVLLRGVNDRLRPRAAALVPGPRLPAADHRADAARRPARLVARGDGHRRGDLRARSSPTSPDARPGAPRQRPGRDLPGRRRPGHGRRHRLGHPPVLRRLRPGPADRRRPGPQLPFAREESDLRARPARWRHRRADRRPVAPRDGPKRPVTASTTSRSSSPPPHVRHRRLRAKPPGTSVEVQVGAPRACRQGTTTRLVT